MKSSVKPVEAPAAARTEPETAAKAKPRLTLPVILMINGVILLTVVLILYFVLRTKPVVPAGVRADSAAADSAGGTTGDSASGAQTPAPR